MSTSSGHIGKVRLIADGQEPGTEIFVIDGKFNLVTKGIGMVEIALPPGLFKVKFKRGSVISEVDADLFPGFESVSVSAPIMEFSSPVPLRGTDTGHEYHQAAAEALSTQIQVRIAEGSQLFVFIRDVDNAGQGNPATGLSLHDTRGRKLVDLALEAKRAYEQDTTMASWAGCNIELNPGQYRIRLNTSNDETLEQVIVLSGGWQTQVFLVRNWYGVRQDKEQAQGIQPKKQWPELSKSSILMAPIGDGFRPSDGNLRLTELARQGLTSGRAVVKENDLEEMLRQKSLNPMLGIFGAHLLLPAIIPIKDQDIMPFNSAVQKRKRRANQVLQQVARVTQDGIIDPAAQGKLKSLLHTVVENLRHLLGDHPDVRALDLQLNQPFQEDFEPGIFETPPMLRRSWEIVIEASVLNPDLVPAGSLADRIANRLWGSGPWVVWRTPPVARRRAKEEPLARLEEAMKQIAKSVNNYEELENVVDKMKLNDLEKGLFSQLSRKAYVTRKEVPKEKKPPSAVFVSTDIELGDAILNLGVPASTTNWAAESLMRKLKKGTK